MEKNPPLPDDCSFIPFQAGGVVYRQGQQRLWVLNTVSAFIWCSLDEHSTTSELAGHISKTFHIPEDQALHDLLQVLKQFEKEGLIANHSHPTAATSQAKPIPFRITTQRLAGNPKTPASLHIELLHTRIQITCTEDKLITELKVLFDHLQQQPLATQSANLHITTENGKYSIYQDDLKIEPLLRPEEIIPGLFTLIFGLFSAGLGIRYLAFHAAVVARNSQAIIFPAESGSGKTTLTALLSAHGWTAYTDELAVIDKSTGEVHPFNLPFSAKEGGAVPLSETYAGIGQLRRYLRHDGKWVRYFIPKKFPNTSESDEATPIRAIIFPKYAPAPTDHSLESIEKAIALEKIAINGSSGRLLTEEDAIALVKLIENTPCYQLHYSNVDEVIPLLDAL